MFNRISAREWNDHVRHLGTRYPLKVRTQDPALPAHAWQVTPQYDEPLRRWTATVRAGSVNGRIATAAVAYGRLNTATQDWVKLRFPSQSWSDLKMVDVPLDFSPPIDLSWREIGGDATPIAVSGQNGEIRQTFESVPMFFLQRGVRRPGSTALPELGQRRLFACDVILRQPRTALANEISILEGGLLGGSILSVNAVSVTPLDSAEPAKVVALSRFVTSPVQNNFEEIFFQRFLDEPTDELHLSTIYALSHPLEKGSSFPEGIDQTFELMTRYYCHYNLAHATRTLPRARTPPLTLVTGLAAGLGDALFNLILSTQNDFAQSVVDLFNQRSLRGSFWAV